MNLPPPLPTSPAKVPPVRTQGRPFNTSTRMGQIMRERGLRPTDVCRATGVYVRTMTNYLNSTERPNPGKLNALCRFFELTPDELGFGPR